MQEVRKNRPSSSQSTFTKLFNNKNSEIKQVRLLTIFCRFFSLKIGKIGQYIKQFCLYVEALFSNLYDLNQVILLSRSAVFDQILKFLVVSVDGDLGAVI